MTGYVCDCDIPKPSRQIHLGRPGFALVGGILRGNLLAHHP